MLDAGRLDCQGDTEWMANALNEMVEVEQIDPTKVVKDAAGNVIMNAGVNIAKTLKGKDLKKRLALIKKKMVDGDPLDSDDEEIAYEHDL